jgi:Zn finger protein HypA/HybF involved in hydrogenase expression
LNASTGAITGTPTTAGYYNITAKVVDASGKSDTSTCPIVVVNSPVNLDCGPCRAGKAYLGTAYNSSMLVSGAKGPNTFSIISGSLPPGLGLNAATGLISGTPTKAGTYTFTAKVVDSNGNSDTDICTIVVVGAPPVNLDCGACGNGFNNGKVGSPYTAMLSVSGGKSPFTFTISSGSLPPGLTLNGTGTIAGTPTAAGSYTFTAKVTDANGSTDTATCTITITGSTINLDCGACGSGKATVGVAYSTQLVVTGGTPSYSFSIVSGSLPPGLTLGASTGKISGTPTKAGSYTFTSMVKDSKGKTDTQNCTLVVTGTPINLDCSTSCGTSSYTSVGSSYSAALKVTGGTPAYTFSIVSGSLPPGLTLSTTNGVISGTPTTAGTFTFTSMVKDSKGNTDTQTCTIVVSPSALNLLCGTCGNGRATVGTGYSATMSVTGGTPNYTYSIQSGSLPPGLTLNSSSGAISGTPTTAGTYQFTSKVVDSKGKSDTAICTIVVVGSPVDLGCGTCSAGKATAGTAYSATMKVTGGAAPFTFSLTSGSLPAGLTLNTSTGVISGTPTTVGTANFTIKVVDANGKSDTSNCSIQVIAPAVNLDCGPCSSSKTTVGASYSADMKVTGGKGPYTFSIVKGSLPPGVTLNSSTGHLGGTPTTAGNYTFTSKVVDANGSSDTDTCTIVVQQRGW